jgi:hypothetical protein
LIDVVEGVEHPEDIHAIFLGLLAELIYGIIGKRFVRDTIGTSEQHLERYIGHQFSHLAESVPWIFIQKAHGDVESSTTPVLQSPCIGKGMTCVVGDIAQINGADPGGE